MSVLSPRRAGIYRQVLVLLLVNTWGYTGRYSSYWPIHGNIQAGTPPIGQYMGIYRQVLLLLANKRRALLRVVPTTARGGLRGEGRQMGGDVHLLTDVAAVHLVAHEGPQRLWDRPLQLDREVADAPSRVHHVVLHDGCARVVEGGVKRGSRGGHEGVIRGSRGGQVVRSQVNTP
eukprot:945866-Prorocentrum_minimum.AAC.2